MEGLSVLFESRQRRLIALIIMLLVVAAYLLLRLLVIPFVSGAERPSGDVVSAAVLDTFFATLVTGAGVAALVYWLTPPAVRRGAMSIIGGHEIGSEFDRMLTGASGWSFRGGTGRWVRAVVLPRLAASARRDNRSMDVYLEVLNPWNSDACQQYAQYRARARSGLGSQWTAHNARNQILATLVLSVLTAQRHPLLRLRVHVTDVVSVFRLDWSSTGAMVTKEDPREPALYCRPNEYFHIAYGEDLRLSEQRSTPLPIGAVALLPDGAVSKDNVKLVLDQLGPDLDLADTDLAQIASLASAPENPYG